MAPREIPAPLGVREVKHKKKRMQLLDSCAQIPNGFTSVLPNLVKPLNQKHLVWTRHDIKAHCAREKCDFDSNTMRKCGIKAN